MLQKVRILGTHRRKGFTEVDWSNKWWNHAGYSEDRPQ